VSTIEFDLLQSKNINGLEKDIKPKNFISRVCVGQCAIYCEWVHWGKLEVCILWGEGGGELKHLSGWVLTSGNLEAQTSKRVG